MNHLDANKSRYNKSGGVLRRPVTLRMKEFSEEMVTDDEIDHD